jgi:hypothetical protein
MSLLGKPFIRGVMMVLGVGFVLLGHSQPMMPISGQYYNGGPAPTSWATVKAFTLKGNGVMKASSKVGHSFFLTAKTIAGFVQGDSDPAFIRVAYNAKNYCRYDFRTGTLMATSFGKALCIVVGKNKLFSWYHPRLI